MLKPGCTLLLDTTVWFGTSEVMTQSLPQAAEMWHKTQNKKAESHECFVPTPALKLFDSAASHHNAGFVTGVSTKSLGSKTVLGKNKCS